MSFTNGLRFLLATFIVIVLGVAFAFAGGARIKNVIDDPSKTMGDIIVEIEGTGSYWVGCTVFPVGRGKYEVDLDAQKVSAPGTVKFPAVSKAGGFNTLTGGGLDYTVALWQDKISLKECEKKYGANSDSCQWAKSNGYQMEGRLDSREGKMTP
ncbi:hypothetical protein K8I61_04935 [bacterium]|nr:hypothetical protein [bacterium]